MTLDLDVRATFAAAGATFTLDVDLHVAAGETLVVLGPSGSGKTLVLETVAGFHPHEGSVRVDGEDVTDAPPESRGLGFVFQDYALFPHLTVRENVAFGTRYHDETRDPDALLESLDVASLADRYPRTLSGGERQRVALARALAIRPRAFLLDEPLSALDVPTRQRLRADLADVLADETALYVTHNRTTARALADRVAVVRAGRVVQAGDVDDVFERPETPFVARFTGANCLPVEAVPGGVALLDEESTEGFDAARPDGSTEETTHVAIRPEYVELGGSDATGEVCRVVREDAAYRVTVSVGGERLDALVREPPSGERVGVRLPPDKLITVRELGQ